MNKPGYSIIKNFFYAIEGLKESFKNERAFQIETVAFVVLGIILWLLPLSLLSKVILQTSLFLPLIAELFNSAIERCVDLACQKKHPLAKFAKDAAAAAVLLTLLFTAGIWVGVCIFEFF